MAENEIPLTLTADTKDAEKSINKFEKNTSSSVAGIEKAFAALKVAAAAAVAVFAGKQIIDGLGKAIDAASEADLAVQKLNIALASTGEFSAEASDELQAYAAKIQETTTVSDDAAIAALGLAKNFGITNDQARDLVSAAIDLSAATGDDLNTSVEKLGGTFSGTVGKLSKLGPEFKNLTEEQLRSGEAIALVTKRFDGFSEGLTKTFSGAVAQARNNFEDIFESFGRIITQNPIVIGLINKVSESFASLSNFLDDNSDSMREFVSKAVQGLLSAIPSILDGLKLIIDGFRALIKTVGISADILNNFLQVLADSSIFKGFFGALINGFDTVLFAASRTIEYILTIAKALGTDDSFKKFGLNLDELRKTANDFTNGALKNLATGNDKVIDSSLKVAKVLGNDAVKALEKLDKEAPKVTKAFDNFSASVKGQVSELLKIDPASKAAGLSIQNNISGANRALVFTKEQIEKIKKELEGLVDKNKALDTEIKNIGRGQFDTLQNNLNLELERLGVKKEQLATEGLLTKELEAQLDEQAKLLKQKTEKQTIELGKQDIIPQGTVDKLKSAVGEGAGNFAGSINSAFGSFAGGFGAIMGAVNGVLDFAQQIIDFIPGVLGKLTNIFNSLVELPGKIVLGFRDLFKSIVNYIKNYFPELLKNLGDLIFDVVDFLAESLPDAIISLVEKLPDIIVKLIDRLPEVIPKFITGLIEAQPRIAVALIDAFILKGGAIKIGVAIAKAMAIEVPKAIVKGMISGVTGVGIALGKLFPDSVKRAFTGIGGRLATDFSNGLRSFFANIGAQFSTLFQGIFSRGAAQLSLSFTTAVQSLYNGILTAFNTAIQTLQTFFTNIGAQLSSVFTTAANSILNAIVQGALKIYEEAFAGLKRGALKIYEEAFEGIKRGALFIFDKLKEAFDIFGDLVDKVKDAFKGGGGGTLGKIVKGDFGGAGEDIKNIGKGGSKKGPVTGIKGSPIATGGLIPKGFPNDTFPARLTSGELVIPTDMVQQLGQFLDSPKKGGDDQAILIALLSKIAASLNQPQTVESKVELNGRELANIILNLSRSNARLSA